MTPVDYEKIIADLLDKQVDMETLVKNFNAEKEKRDRANEIKGLRDTAVLALLEYLTATVDDEKVQRYLDSDEAFEDLARSFDQVAKEISAAIRLKDALSKKKESGDWDIPCFYDKNSRSTDDTEDAIRKWLANKRKG